MCFWEDDASQLRFALETGANSVSLLLAQRNYADFGASERRHLAHVDPPDGDARNPEWRPIEFTSDIETVPRVGSLVGPYPNDPSALYYWSATYWRRGAHDPSVLDEYDGGLGEVTPEFLCFDLEVTLQFYRDVLGFQLTYSRPEETFAHLSRGDVNLMFEEITGPGRRWITGDLEPPLGRGINFEIEVWDATSLFIRVTDLAPEAIVVPLEDRKYRVGVETVANRQFVVADPNGYLLRFAESCHPDPDLDNPSERL